MKKTSPRALSQAEAAAAIDEILAKLRELKNNAAVHKAAADAAVAEIEKSYSETVAPIAAEIEAEEARLRAAWCDYEPYCDGQSAAFTHGAVGTRMPPSKLAFKKGVKEADAIEAVKAGDGKKSSYLHGLGDTLVTTIERLNLEVAERCSVAALDELGMKWTSPKPRFYYEVREIEDATS